ncbi:Protein PAM68, chloroplastic [Ananas comosus]|uniref:Protein PAM68, chloroplastic n=1 Tax=Ananas comosus TaxID=4615 RepID=A0A199V7P3_ANACO|nr:Protein PAM68, chloroplastic [Ananas comosus]
MESSSSSFSSSLLSTAHFALSALSSLSTSLPPPQTPSPRPSPRAPSPPPPSLRPQKPSRLRPHTPKGPESAAAAEEECRALRGRGRGRRRRGRRRRGRRGRGDDSGGGDESDDAEDGLSVGIPLSLGLLFFPFFYYLKVVAKVDVPTWIPFGVSFFFFGSALLGVSYGIVSASWDPTRDGSLLGWNEARRNWPVIGRASCVKKFNGFFSI